MGWFIGTIFCLYMLFPWLSRFIKKYRVSALLSLLVISYLSRYLLFPSAFTPSSQMYLWFPLCNLFEFGLGIYIIQHNLYPKNLTDYPLIGRLAELSFYVFLFHMILIWRIIPMLPITESPLVYTVSYFFMMGMVLLVSWIAMVFDSKIQQIIQQNETVKRYLKEWVFFAQELLWILTIKKRSLCRAPRHDVRFYNFFNFCKIFLEIICYWVVIRHPSLKIRSFP